MARREMKYGNESRFCGNIIYDGSVISQILIDGGYITLNDNGLPIYHFYVTDHQGNNRLVVNAHGTIEESNTYYPYGALINSTTNIQRYKYNGKELNQHSYMLWYDYMARQTMPILGRFSSVDPLCEKYYGMSPYAYCAGNPVRYVDRDGMAVFYYGGKVIGNDGLDNNDVYFVGDNDKTTSKMIREGNFTQYVYEHSILMNLSYETRQAMFNEVACDDGNGYGKDIKDAKNARYFQERGGYINEDGSVIPYTPGKVTSPKEADHAELPNVSIERPSFHSHNSGTVVDANVCSDRMSTNATASLGSPSSHIVYGFEQIPSDNDWINAKSSQLPRYLYARGNDNVIIYQYKSGKKISSTIKTKKFNNIGKP